ncbi:MAG: hypothetical protein J2P47_14645 [Acetobacteraceae bacterium]|nr:hypothetical protein [Acetobacteraceae bacterium]
MRPERAWRRVSLPTALEAAPLQPGRVPKDWRLRTLCAVIRRFQSEVVDQLSVLLDTTGYLAIVRESDAETTESGSQNPEHRSNAARTNACVRSSSPPSATRRSEMESREPARGRLRNLQPLLRRNDGKNEWGRPWTPEEDAILRERAKAGDTYYVITRLLSERAKGLGLSIRSANSVLSRARRLGLPRRPNPACPKRLATDRAEKHATKPPQPLARGASTLPALASLSIPLPDAE